MISHDCFECIHCRKAKVLEDRSINVQCELKEKAYDVDSAAGVCPHYKFKMFEMKDQKSFLPYHIWLELTNACNLKCKMCGQRGTYGYLNSPALNMGRKNLPIEAWKDLIDDVKSFRPTILFRGGEPLLYPGIADLMRHISEQNLFLSMDTNGTQLKKHAYDVAKHIDHVNVSIDGPREVHDFVRGVPGTYDSAREGIVALQNAYKELKIRRIRPITLNCVISADNYQAIPEMIKVSEDLGVTDIMLTLCFFYDGKVEESYDDVLQNRLGTESRAGKGFRKDRREVDSELLVKNINLLLAIKKIDFQLIPYIDDTSIKKWFDDPSLLVSYDRCYAPWFLVNVMPNGDVNFCADIGDYIIGNITENSLKDIWFSEKAEKFRAFILEERFSICRRCVVNFLYPHNRNSSLIGLRAASKVIKYALRLPFQRKYFQKHEWLSHSYY